MIPRIALKHAKIANAFFFLVVFEQEDVFVVFFMIADGFIASNKFHITFLAFSRIREAAFGCPSIFIAVGFAAFSGEDKDHRKFPWGPDTALQLPAVELDKCFACVEFTFG